MMTSRFLVPSVLALVVVACGGETVDVGSTSQMELKKKANGDPTGKRWATIRSANANPTVSLDQRARAKNRCARL